VDELLREEPFARGLPVGRLAAMWEQVVGERLAGETAPTTLENGILTVEAASGPWGVQAGFLAEEIRARANEALGGGSIRGVRVVVAPSRHDPRNRR
jgi:predicted nucleic acid-binding Zn ribbon protein